MERGREAQKRLKTAKYNASPWRPAARGFRGGRPSCTVRAPAPLPNLATWRFTPPVRPLPIRCPRWRA